MSIKISAKIKPGAKKEQVEALPDGSFLVWVREKPKGGEANNGARRALAEYFGVSKSGVVLVKGQTSRNKVFEILK